MDILILGNGFDLAHELPTKYSDFLNYCKLQQNKLTAYKPTDPYYTNVWVRHFLNIQQQLGDTWIDLEKEIYKIIKYISNSHMPFKDNHFTFSISFDDNVFNLYNFEKYLHEIPGKPDDKDGEFRRVGEHNYNIYQAYLVGLKGIANFLYAGLRQFTKEFEKYLISYVMPNVDKKENKYKFSLNTTKQKERNKEVFILNFNYTNTFEQLYAKNNDNFIIKNPVYIHGKIGNKDNNMVLGTKSFSNGSISAEFNIFKKHNQRHRYGTIESYQHLLNLVKKQQGQVIFHIIGHSLDNTDHNILKHILLANPNSIINIYYYDEEQLIQMQNNIDLIITEEEVMAKARFVHQHDAERGILIP